MNKTNWSPFDPNWYNEAFDKFIYTSDQLFNTDTILKQGFYLPDKDGSKSSVFRNNSVLNNSFNEKLLRETLKDIYLNSSYKLTASNHDNTHFFQWHGYIRDLKVIENTNKVEFVIPTETFISSKERDLYKLSQFYRKWISVEDIANNWNVFKWITAVFIDQRVFTEYELRIDDREVTIRFDYYDYWLKANYPVYIYKMDTMSSCGCKISKFLCNNEWNWKIPGSYLSDKRILNSTHVIGIITKTLKDRNDGLTRIEVIGDNLEFLNIKDGYIDMSTVSRSNRIYIDSESTEYLNMILFNPKFLHEYPILLPVDSIYQPYEADFQPVSTLKNDIVNHVKVEENDEYKQVYIDMNGKLEKDPGSWKQMIRPVVLADAFDECKEPYDYLIAEINNLRDLTVKGADLVEDFRFFLYDYTNELVDEFNNHIEKILNIMYSIREAHNTFLDKMCISYNVIYENQYEKFLEIMNEIKKDGFYSIYLTNYKQTEEKEDDFFFMVSPLIYIPRELADKYFIINIIHSLTENNKHMWDKFSDNLGKVRFQRPVDETDFWTFEYYPDDEVWRPYHLNMERHFPDVYIPTIESEPVPSLNRLFKAFFFYSDTINVREESDDIIRSTPTWDNDMIEYHFDQEGYYRDIFMEKFYWMGVRAIYKGILATHNRWEAIEYIIDNPSYDRFNELFLKTMDPYFKLGLATYLKSNNFEFPFDDAIAKIEEAINLDFLGYKKITNFEMYLNKTWIPSYFDYITKIMDNWDYTNRLLRRPRSSFDTERIIPILIEIQEIIFNIIDKVLSIAKWIYDRLLLENYNLNIENVSSIINTLENTKQNMSDVLTFTRDLDLDIFSIDDINHIISMLLKHKSMVEELDKQFSIIYQDAVDHEIYDEKQSLLSQIKQNVDLIPSQIHNLVGIVQDFDMDSFMKIINDLSTYFIFNKINPDDISLLYKVNEFNDPWSNDVKEFRNKLFQSTSILAGIFEPDKVYNNEEVLNFVKSVDDVILDIDNFRNSIENYYEHFGYDKDQSIFNSLDECSDRIKDLKINTIEYMGAREIFIHTYDTIKELLTKFDEFEISNTEISYKDNINDSLDVILLALSYIAGKNNHESAVEALNIIDENIDDWELFLNIEEEVFLKIFDLSRPPVSYIDLLNENNYLVDAIIKYLDTVNYEFIPDSSWPTYSDIYEINNVELLTGGFRHEINDQVFIKNIGAYEITEISDDVSSALSINEIPIRTTTFRNPMIQSNPYDSITNGIGLGLTVKPISVRHTLILNDDVIKPFITKIQNAVYLLKKNSSTYNPRNNEIFEKDLIKIKEIKESWNNVLSFYSDYMSPDCKKYMEEITNLVSSSISPAIYFIACRGQITSDDLVINFDKFIVSIYKYAKENKLDNEYFYYVMNMLEIAYNTLMDFYQNGTEWSDGNKFREILDKVEQPLNLFKNKILVEWKKEILDDNKIDEIFDKYSSLIIQISSIKSNIRTTTESLVDLNPIINSINTKLEVIPNLQKDVWYHLKRVKVASMGSGYKVGDVIEIIPKLPTDSDGNEIHEMDDVILNDVILLQVKTIDDGKVTQVVPLLDYAIPYLIWGIRETKTRIGNGEGLTVDVFSYEIEISDSTLFRDNKSDVPLLNQFDENDMFMFKFENIHDLNIEYDVFLGGKQITNFFQRHIPNNDPLHPENIDVIYLNANEVYGLRNSSIFIPAENYFIYKIDKIDIIDPGAGYCKGQDIILDTGLIPLWLKVAKLAFEPYKGIAEIELDGIITSKEYDPNIKNAKVVKTSLNNIDDEYNVGYYSSIDINGIEKNLIKSSDEYKYVFHRFDNMDGDDQNSTYLYPDVNMPLVDDVADNGDPDSHWYLGSRIDNSQHPMSDERRWNGIYNIIPPTDPQLPDNLRVPTDKPIKGEYQNIMRELIHKSSEDKIIKGDFSVQNYKDLPKHKEDYPDGGVGKIVIVETDETHRNHRMAYRIRTFIISGFFIYDKPFIADYEWNEFNVDFMNIDFYPDLPTLKALYPSEIWESADTYRKIEQSISDKKIESVFPDLKKNTTTYILNLTVDDLSVFNWTTKEWEDLHDETRWNLEVINDDNEHKWGFNLKFIGNDEFYEYDMVLYLDKVPDTQQRNALLKREAVMDVIASILKEINTLAINRSVNTGRHLRIRKLFPYEQKESYTIGYDENKHFIGYEMDFKVANYIHYKNELHLEDVKIFNKSANRFENLLDTSMFEVRFKDPKAVNRGYETQTKIVQTLIGNAGSGFIDGNVWGWNAEYEIHIFGKVTADYSSNGHIITFDITHCPNPPKENISLEFMIFQHDSQSEVEMATVLVEFITERLEVYGDGYIHNVTNRLSPLPKEFKVIVKYDLSGPQEYDLIIDKNPKKWTFIEPNWMMSPTFHIDKNISPDRLYVLTDNGRFPIINPATNKPSIRVVENETGSDITFLNLYRRYEHLHICTMPYPMRSIYVKRKIPSHGFIDLKGKINKPLNKKYFEFWVNGKLLYDEVTIISPTKIFLHGLTSLKNLEIIEINRDSNEYFSDSYLEISQSKFGRPYVEWNYQTYLDGALEGTLKNDNYTTEEQSYLLSPVWPQVDENHPEYKNYPPNVDKDDDILLRTNPDDYPINELEDPSYQFLIINQPTLEGKPLNDQTLSFKHFGFKPISNDILIDIMNEEWKDEIENNPYFPEHTVLTEDVWYGITTRLYDEYGILVGNLNDSVYNVSDDNILKINTSNKTSRIVKNPIKYDLT